MAKYAAQLTRTASTTQSVGSITSSATVRRIKIMDILVGSQATPADNAFLWQFQRCTAAGTATAVTPFPLDAADGAALTVCGQNHSIEPTYTANAILLALPLNQRMTFRWVAAPGEELVIPATSANGIGIQTPTSTAVAVTTHVIFEEQ